LRTKRGLNANRILHFRCGAGSTNTVGSSHSIIMGRVAYGISRQLSRVPQESGQRTALKEIAVYSKVTGNLPQTT
jgi:hypothetical protein